MLNDLKASLFLFYKYITRGNKGTLILTVLVAALAFLQINTISGIMSGAVSLILKGMLMRSQVPVACRTGRACRT